MEVTLWLTDLLFDTLVVTPLLNHLSWEQEEGCQLRLAAEEDLLQSVVPKNPHVVSSMVAVHPPDELFV